MTEKELDKLVDEFQKIESLFENGITIGEFVRSNGERFQELLTKLTEEESQETYNYNTATVALSALKSGVISENAKFEGIFGAQMFGGTAYVSKELDEYESAEDMEGTIFFKDNDVLIAVLFDGDSNDSIKIVASSTDVVLCNETDEGI